MSKEAYREDNQECEQPENTAAKTGLGKEAKIGVAVIGILLVVFGVVVAMRLMGSDGEPKPIAGEPGAGPHKPALDPKNELMLKDNRPKSFGNPPTVVSAKGLSAKPPKSASIDMDRWKTTSDRHESKRSLSGNAPMSAPPTFMPEPPKPSRTDSQDRYAMDPPSPRDMHKAGMPGDDPLRGSKAEIRESRQPGSHRAMSSRDSSDGFASVEAPPALPPYRERSRLDDPMPPQPSGSLRDRPVSAMPASQYGNDDYRRELPPEPRHAGMRSRRSSAAPMYNNPPPRRDDGKYEVQPNDSYWTISEKLYGMGAYFKALSQHNSEKGVTEERLRPGELIFAPELAELEKSYPDLCPKSSRREAMQSQARASTVSARGSFGGRTYTVAEGDTLFNIARYELGKASRWAEIYELNRDVLGKDFNYLAPGTQLTLPDGEKSDVIARPPNSTYRR